MKSVRDKDRDVSIGLSLSISPAQFDPSSDAPLYLVVTARILQSSRPDTPVTLATNFNALDRINNKSFENISCLSTSTTESNQRKYIEVWPRFHVRGFAYKDVRNYFHFVTIEPGKTFTVKHEIPKERILATGLEKGETYRTKITDVGLGTYWWMYGTLEEVEGMKFLRWEMEETAEDYNDDGEDKPWLHSENPKKLALVIEKGDAEFEIV